MSVTLPGDSYALPRDATETARLNKQHNHLLSAFEFHLHPAIAATLQAAVKGASNDLRIADVACGTGKPINFETMAVLDRLHFSIQMNLHSTSSQDHKVNALAINVAKLPSPLVLRSVCQ